MIQILSRESWIRLQESAKIDDLVDNVTWVTATHHALAIAVLGLDQIIDCFFVVGYASALAVLQKDPLKLVFGGIGDIDLVGDPSQKGLVHKIGRIEVGREYYQLLEGDFELFACVKGEIVDTLFEGYDPSVEERFVIDTLSAKVIDQQKAAIALELDRGFVQLGAIVKL